MIWSILCISYLLCVNRCSLNCPKNVEEVIKSKKLLGEVTERECLV